MGLDLQRFVGAEAGPPFEARDEVNQAMIRHWTDAIGDRNPVYTDPEAAAKSVHGGIVAPPTMLQAWTMRGLNPPDSAHQRGQAELMQILDEAGYTSVVATNCEQEYMRYLRPGDRLTGVQTFEAISDEKHTALGDGIFVTSLTTYADQHGEVVGTMRFRILKFKPPAKVEQTQAHTLPRPRPAINQDNAYFWEGVDRGELLIQRCTACQQLRHPPMPACAKCGSLEWDTVASTGRGTVYSWVVPHYPVVPMFEYPYIVVLVELDEGVRLVSNLVDIEPDDVKIGMPVEVTFVQTDPELTLPMFRPA
jgi:uncharacterized OB-fold protein/acyl dehydratase